MAELGAKFLFFPANFYEHLPLTRFYTSYPLFAVGAITCDHCLICDLPVCIPSGTFRCWAAELDCVFCSFWIIICVQMRYFVPGFSLCIFTCNQAHKIMLDAWLVLRYISRKVSIFLKKKKVALLWSCGLLYGTYTVDQGTLRQYNTKLNGRWIDVYWMSVESPCFSPKAVLWSGNCV